MSLTFDPNTGDPIHTPKRRDVFEFDHEVASIFENMALRSIPMYAQTHHVHAAIAKSYAEDHFMEKQYVVADIGSSTGMFIKTLCSQYGIPPHQEPGHFRAIAVDPSQHMLDNVVSAMPWVVDVNMEVQFLASIHTRVDIVNLSYVLQFIHREERMLALQSIAKATRPGGLLFVSQKESIPSMFEPYFTEEYVRFRIDNGYTDQEIADKTNALSNSMWVDQPRVTKDMVESVGFWNVQDTTRWLGFSSFVCMKR